MRIFVLTIVLLFTAVAHGQGIGPHVSGGHLGGSAAGLDDGYSEANAFVPLWQPNRDSLLFADGSFLFYNDGSDFRGGNLGGGVRSWQDFSNSIVGVYGYYDRRELDVSSFDQFGLGIESLGYLWDARLNVNVPVGAATYSQTTAPGFIGTGFGTRTTSIHGLTVLDAEVGAVLWANETWQLRSFVGAYGLFDNVVQDTPGVRSRIEARVNDQCWIGGFIEHDREFDTTGGATFTWRFGRGKKACNNSGYNVMARLGDPVQRRKYVALGKSERTTLATIQGQALRIAHFIPGGDGLTGQSVTPSGDGSVEKPYNSLAFVETSTADVVYIHPGVYEGASMRVTREGQQVLAASESVSLQMGGHYVATTPMSGFAIISNSPGDGVNVAADNVTVQGLHITGAGVNGIRVHQVADARLVNNTVSYSGFHGIEFTHGASGDIIGNTICYNNYDGICTFFNTPHVGDIVGNQISYNGWMGARISHLYGDFRDNRLVENSVLMYELRGDFEGNHLQGIASAQLGEVFGNINGNIVTDGGNGIWIRQPYSSNAPDVLVHGNVINNVFANTWGWGLRIEGSVDGYVRDNISTENGQLTSTFPSNAYYGGGILVEANVIGNVDGNVAASNRGHGIYVHGNVLGAILNNTANNNSYDGIYVGGAIAGDVINNTTNNNGEDGIQVEGNVAGAVDANVADENGQKGIAVLGNIGMTLYENRVNGNGDAGISVGGAIGGPVSYNIVSGNGGDGLAVNGSVGGDLVFNVFDDNHGYGAAIQGNVGNCGSPGLSDCGGGRIIPLTGGPKDERIECGRSCPSAAV